MKSKFSTIDLCAVIHDLRVLISMRVVNVYDINSKTYIIKLQKPNEKAFILFESGIRIHRTTYDWPKSMFPSGFSMKFRKHINQKRLTGVSQVGMDRIIDLEFGEEDRCCHVIVELYDRGNVVLTDNNYIILNILRPRTDADTDVKFTVRERYPLENARQENYLPTLDNIRLFLENGKQGDLLKKALVRHAPFTSLLLEHALINIGLPSNCQIGVHLCGKEEDVQLVQKALMIADAVSRSVNEKPGSGYIAYTSTIRDDGKIFESYQEFYPVDFSQFRQPGSKFRVLELPSFSEAVDKFYSSINAQKAEQKVSNVEKEAAKKLDNIRKDHEHRVKALEDMQLIQERRGEYVQYNKELVEQGLLLTRTALANKMSWDEVTSWLEQVASKGVEAAKVIVKLNFTTNSITMRLKNPYEESEEPMNVEIDIGLTADQNVRKYFGDKKSASVKQQKTLSSSNKALMSAQQKIQNSVDQVKNKSSSVIRARRAFWFEKFYWFISSDSYLVVAGRDSQQNEMLVKRYLRPGDIYVHAEIAGASSVIIRNKSRIHGESPPPRTLNEAGTMAICFSTAWEAKVVINAWWVRHDQVSRTAQTGEYLPSGSFMIRGKRNFLPTCQLQLGFGLLFSLDDETIEKRKAQLKTGSNNSLNLIKSIINDEQGNEDDASLKDESGNESGGESEVNEKLEFPDVQVNLKSIHISEPTQGEEEFSVINLASSSNKATKKTETDIYLEEKNAADALAGEEHVKAMSRPITKRQKHKLEKIRKKYKDQDEDERKIRMELLGSVGETKKKGNSGTSCTENRMKDPKTIGQKEKTHKDREHGNLADDGEIEEEQLPENVQDEQPIIDSLTSSPSAYDGILFSIPVCAPYSSMQKFKFKVKVTPGTGKRGKAVKMALALFLRDKSITQTERVLIKNLTMDDHVAQNIPGKVRVSAPQLLSTKFK